MTRYKTVDDLNPKVREQAASQLPAAKVNKAKRNKYNATKTWGPAPMGNGKVLYDSGKEARQANDLEALRNAGEVEWWERQRRFTLPPTPGEERGAYVVDFEVHWRDGSVTYEDVKGATDTPAYREFKRKARVVKEVYGVEIMEI